MVQKKRLYPKNVELSSNERTRPNQDPDTRTWNVRSATTMTMPTKAAKRAGASVSTPAGRIVLSRQSDAALPPSPHLVSLLPLRVVSILPALSNAAAVRPRERAVLATNDRLRNESRSSRDEETPFVRLTVVVVSLKNLLHCIGAERRAEHLLKMCDGVGISRRQRHFDR